jgi:hypothetical protein
MKMMRKAALTMAAALLGFGAIGISAPAAHADTNWPCSACFKAGR